MKHHFDMVENHFKIKKGVKNHFIPVKNHTMMPESEGILPPADVFV